MSMKDEIKEILEYLKNDNYFTENPEYEVSPYDLFKSLNSVQIDKLLDYITNLQEELEDLREDNYAYHQLMRMQNKREYRSKFLKEFQQEYNTNTFPDYDEIYKRYDKLKKENERLIKEKSILEKSLKLMWKKKIKIDYEELDKANKAVEKDLKK